MMLHDLFRGLVGVPKLCYYGCLFLHRFVALFNAASTVHQRIFWLLAVIAECSRGSLSMINVLEKRRFLLWPQLDSNSLLLDVQPIVYCLTHFEGLNRYLLTVLEMPLVELPKFINCCKVMVQNISASAPCLNEIYDLLLIQQFRSQFKIKKSELRVQQD